MHIADLVVLGLISSNRALQEQMKSPGKALPALCSGQPGPSIPKVLLLTTDEIFLIPRSLILRS